MLLAGAAAASPTAKEGEPAARLPETSRTLRLDLSGHGRDDPIPWEFRCRRGRNCGSWTTLPVPSNWELQGFGAYAYGRNEEKGGEIADYRLRFTVPAEWRERAVELVFDGVMTDAVVTLNGTLLGEHRGGFYPFRFGVDGVLRAGGENLLEVTVREESASPSVNRAERDADYWVFGGIHRPVYLLAHPPRHLGSVAVDARADGRLAVSAEVAGAGEPGRVEVSVHGRDGRRLGSALTAPTAAGAGRVELGGRIPGITPWSAESPRLYRLRARLVQAGRPVHARELDVGFRTVEVRPGDGVYVNGVRTVLRGINRHSFWPDSGRTTSAAISELDVERILAMNLNAVRTAHHPPDEHFLAACDRAGLYVIDELAGWKAAYSTADGRPLVEAMVRRDRNHPSVLLWANGNEGGWNLELDAEFHRHDPQRRPVIHPREEHGGLYTRHYPDWATLEGLLSPRWLDYARARAFGVGQRSLPGPPWRPLPAILPTESLHGLWDGGLGAGLADFWSLIRRSPRGAGLFLWALFDEAVVRTDLPGRPLDTAGNQAPDGALGPYRQPEGSFAAIRRILAPVRLKPSADPFDGRLVVENRFARTDLAAVEIRWSLLEFPAPGEVGTGHRVLAAGVAPRLAEPPGESAELRLPLPDGWRRADAVAIEAIGPRGRTLDRRHLPVRSRAEVAARLARPGGPRPALRRSPGEVRLATADLEIALDAATGRLRRVVAQGRPFALGGGPRPIGGGGRPAAVEERGDATRRTLVVTHDGELAETAWTLHGSGWLELAWRWRRDGHPRLLGVGFDHPPGAVRALRWLGGGPFRVWANRREGTLLDVWRKSARDPGARTYGLYPELEGYHAPPYWAELETDAGTVTLVFPGPPLHLQLLRPPPLPDPGHASAPFPDADLAFLHRIPPIGTKLRPAASLGPSSAARSGGVEEGRVWMSFEARSRARTGGGLATSTGAR